MRAFLVGLGFLLGVLFLTIAIELLLVVKHEKDFFSNIDCKVGQITDKKLEIEITGDLDIVELIIYYKHEGMLFDLYAMNESELRLFNAINLDDYIEICTNKGFRVVKKINAMSI